MAVSNCSETAIILLYASKNVFNFVVHKVFTITIGVIGEKYMKNTK
jgi:hypothetical protein